MPKSGFTFVELIVALAIMASMSLTWCWILGRILSPSWLLLLLSVR